MQARPGTTVGTSAGPSDSANAECRYSSHHRTRGPFRIGEDAGRLARRAAFAWLYRTPNVVDVGHMLIADDTVSSALQQLITLAIVDLSSPMAGIVQLDHGKHLESLGRDDEVSNLPVER